MSLASLHINVCHTLGLADIKTCLYFTVSTLSVLHNSFKHTTALRCVMADSVECSGAASALKHANTAVQYVFKDTVTIVSSKHSIINTVFMMLADSACVRYWRTAMATQTRQSLCCPMM